MHGQLSSPFGPKIGRSFFFSWYKIKNLLILNTFFCSFKSFKKNCYRSWVIWERTFSRLQCTSYLLFDALSQKFDAWILFSTQVWASSLLYFFLEYSFFKISMITILNFRPIKVGPYSTNYWVYLMIFYWFIGINA